MIPSLVILSACANKTGVAETESTAKTGQDKSSLEQEYEKELENKNEKERQKKEAEQRAAKNALAIGKCT